MNSTCSTSGLRAGVLATLAKLTPEERAQQRDIRWQLYRYVDRIWDDIKAYARSVNMSGDPLAGNSGYDLAGDPGTAPSPGCGTLPTSCGATRNRHLPKPGTRWMTKALWLTQCLAEHR
jgi:hypothetical protein